MLFQWFCTLINTKKLCFWYEILKMASVRTHYYCYKKHLWIIINPLWRQVVCLEISFHCQKLKFCNNILVVSVGKCFITYAWRMMFPSYCWVCFEIRSLSLSFIKTSHLCRCLLAFVLSVCWLFFFFLISLSRSFL